MNGADWFDLGMGVIPRKVARLVVLALVLFSGGGFITWYAQEKAESMQATVQEMVDGLMASLPTPTVAPVVPTP